MYRTTLNDDSLKGGLKLSAGLHLALFLFLFFGLPRLVPPLPAHHGPIPFEIVTIGELTNTRVAETPESKPAPPPPAEPPKPQPAPPQPQEKPAPPTPPPPAPPKVEEKAEALKPQEKPKPIEKPKPAEEAKPQPDLLASVLKDVSKLKQPPKPAEAKQQPTETKENAGATSNAPALASRLMITEEDALRRQIEGCWSPPIGARDAQNLIVDITIDVNQDRTVASAEVVDKSRYGSDPFFRAAGDAAIRAVRNPKCSPLQLPPEKYEQWKRITFTFDPRDML